MQLACPAEPRIDQLSLAKLAGPLFRQQLHVLEQGLPAPGNGDHVIGIAVSNRVQLYLVTAAIACTVLALQ